MPPADCFSPTPSGSSSGRERGHQQGTRGASGEGLVLTHFSLSPSHLDIRSEEDTEKKVELLASVATALAR